MRRHLQVAVILRRGGRSTRRKTAQTRILQTPHSSFERPHEGAGTLGAHRSGQVHWPVRRVGLASGLTVR